MKIEVAAPCLTPALGKVVGDRQVDPRQGTAVKKDYQKNATRAMARGRREVAMAELGVNVHESRLAMAAGIGLQAKPAARNLIVVGPGPAVAP
ncbi:MAG: hypothetical protein M0Z51_16315 [Propionibacterium sp.]|nr:hypothetical protein [Propionibacterium sp.]